MPETTGRQRGEKTSHLPAKLFDRRAMPNVEKVEKAFFQAQPHGCTYQKVVIPELDGQYSHWSRLSGTGL
jgi:hypothetical protein